MWLMVTKSLVWWYSCLIPSTTCNPPAAVVNPMVNMHFVSSQASWHHDCHLDIQLQPLRICNCSVSHIVNYCLMQAHHITTNPTWAHLIPRSLLFLAPPLLEGCGHPHCLPCHRCLPRHCCLPHHPQYHGPWPTTTTASTGVLIGAQVHQQEVGVLTTGRVYQQEAGVSTGGRCIDNRACILTGGMHIDNKAGVSTTGQVYCWWGRCTDDGAGALTVRRHINGRMGIPIVWQTYQQRLGMSSGGRCLDSWVGILMMSRCILTFINPQPKATLLAQ